jgi:hypothetical protein
MKIAQGKSAAVGVPSERFVLVGVTKRTPPWESDNKILKPRRGEGIL